MNMNRLKSLILMSLMLATSLPGFSSQNTEPSLRVQPPAWSGTIEKKASLSFGGRSVSNSPSKEAEYFNIYYNPWLKFRYAEYRSSRESIFSGKLRLPKISGVTFEDAIISAKTAYEQTEILLAVAVSLKRIHSLGLIHGDVHRFNFILNQTDDRWAAYPVDFGHTKAIGDGAYVTSGDNGYGAEWWSPDRKGYDSMGKKPRMPSIRPPAHPKHDIYSFFKITRRFYLHHHAASINLISPLDSQFEKLASESMTYRHSWSSVMTLLKPLDDIISRLEAMRVQFKELNSNKQSMDTYHDGDCEESKQG